MPEFTNTPDTTEKKHDILTQHHDGRVTCMGKNYATDIDGGNISINVRVPGLREIEYVTHIQLRFDPITTHGGVLNKKITGNVVGMTIMNIGAGTTYIVEVQAIGSP